MMTAFSERHDYWKRQIGRLLEARDVRTAPSGLPDVAGQPDYCIAAPARQAQHIMPLGIISMQCTDQLTGGPAVRSVVQPISFLPLASCRHRSGNVQV